MPFHDNMEWLALEKTDGIVVRFSMFTLEFFSPFKREKAMAYRNRGLGLASVKNRDIV